MTRVLLFSRAAEPSRAARIHDPKCAMVRAARQSRGRIVVIEGDDVAEQAADLGERGFPVISCKCLGDDGERRSA